MKFQGLFIDGFAGGGGASTGIAQAIGRDVDIAVNHSETAIAIHRANHPTATHFCQDIKALWPKAATRMQPVAGAWFSPDCKEFSKAKGGPVKDRSIRALCWEVVHWLEEVQPTVGYLENVEEFEYAAPLDSDGVPIRGQEGREFRRFVRAIRSLGYRVQWRVLRACDYGAPTSRKRLYMVMRRDGLPIRWPKPTHGAPGSPGVRRGKLLPYRAAAECIDWSIPCPSIFDRQRPLAEATLRRIAHGVMRYVVNAAQPFIVGTAFTNTRAAGVFDCEDPLRTITTQPEYGVADVELAFCGNDAAHSRQEILSSGSYEAWNLKSDSSPSFGILTKKVRSSGAQNTLHPSPRTSSATAQATAGRSRLGGLNPHCDRNDADRGGDLWVAAPHVAKFRTGSTGSDMGDPMPTVTANGEPARPAGACPLGIAGATLVKMGNGERDGQQPRALDPVRPLGTVTAKGSQAAAVTAFLSSFYTQGTNNRDARRPHPTVMAESGKSAVVAAHLEQANGGPRNRNSAGRDARRPLSTATTTGSQQRIVETTLLEEGALPPEMMARAVDVAAFLVKYYSTDGESEIAQIQPVDRPIDTVTTKARFAVVTVTIDSRTYVIVDIGLRMLKPRELANAQGFPPDYVLDPPVRKLLRGKWVERPLTIAEQISAIGNSVCPPMARALVAANQPGIPLAMKLPPWPIVSG